MASPQCTLLVKQSQAHAFQGEGTQTQPVDGRYVIEFGASFKATTDIISTLKRSKLRLTEGLKTCHIASSRATVVTPGQGIHQSQSKVGALKAPVLLT